MKEWMHKLEVFVDKIIPVLLVVLLAIIIGEFFFHEVALKYQTVIMIFDWFIISIFAIDLTFKYHRSRSFPKFLRASWLDIIAIFPFFLVFRVLEGFLGIFVAGGETLSSAQKVVHVGVELEKSIGGVVKEGEVIAQEASRFERFTRFLNPITRSVRFLILGDKEVRDDAKEEFVAIEKLAKKETKKVEKDILQLEKEVESVPTRVKAALYYEKPKITNFFNAKINKQKN
jgi:hypothetical protein